MDDAAADVSPYRVQLLPGCFTVWRGQCGWAAVAGAREQGLTTTRFFQSSEEAAAAALTEVRAGDLILIKGSRSVETDKIVAGLKERFPLAGADES